MKLLFLSVCLLVLTIAGCTKYGATPEQNNKNLLKLRFGVPKSKILEVMGEPYTNENYQIEGRNCDVWFYRTSRTPEDDFTPIVLIDGMLAGWGRNFYRNIRDSTIKIEQDIKIEPRN